RATGRLPSLKHASVNGRKGTVFAALVYPPYRTAPGVVDMAGARFEARGARGAMVALVVVAVALFVLLAWPDTAAAKCPDWLLTGGDLGEYAFKFDACGEGASIDRIAGDEVDPPAVDPGTAYAIHDDGWFDPQEYHRFVLHWYPDAGLLFGRAPRDPQVDLDRGDRWMRPDDETRRFLDGAVAEALRRHAAADLEQGLIAANFRARGMADG